MVKCNPKISSHFICLCAILLFLNCGGKYNWYPTYKDDKKHVYGTYIVKRYLDNISKDNKTDITRKLSKYFDKDEEKSGNYIFVGEAMLVDEFDAEALVSFVEAGNTAFISTNVFPNTISELIIDPCREKIEEDYFIDHDDKYDDDDIVSTEEEVEELRSDTTAHNNRENWEYYDFDHLNFMIYGTEVVNMQLDVESNGFILTDSIYRTVKNQEPFYMEWYYLHDSLACLDNNDIEVLGYMVDTMINFVKMPYGDGTFYIHSSPFVFTNINLLNDNTSAYIESILGEGAEAAWHWDEYSRTNATMGRSRNTDKSFLSNKGPLTYMLKQKSLKWAWYSLLAMGGLFMLFRAKRKQRVVPVVEKNENTSLAFVNTIGTLYFNKNDHKQLCKDQMQMWLEDVRHHYRINTSKLDDNFVMLLSAKTKKSKVEIQGLLDYYTNIVNGGFVSENTMVTFYQKLNKFDIQSKSRL